MQKNGSIYINTNRTIVFSLGGLLEEGRTELARVAQTLPYTPSPIALPPKKRLLAEGRTELTRETPTFS